MDDNDIIQGMKLWQSAEDPVLSYWCQCVIRRQLPKTIISSQPFTEEFIHGKIKEVNEKLGIHHAADLVYQIKRSLLPYDTQKQPINLLQKSGSVLRLDESEDQLLSGLIAHKTTRYILTYPRI
jgi:hypothetical protein